MDAWPKISVIIPMHNLENYIEACLQSVSDQTYVGKIECILVDDYSTDKTLEKVYAFIIKNKKEISYQVIKHQQNLGAACARNSGIKESTGDYIMFIDGDDTITPECIDQHVKILRKYPQVEIIKGSMDIPGFPFNKLSNNLDVEYLEDYKLINYYWTRKIPWSPINMLIERKWLVDNDLYFQAGAPYEDLLWHLEADKHIHSIAFNYIDTYNYTLRRDSTTSLIDAKKHMRNGFEVAKRCFSSPHYRDSLFSVLFIFEYCLFPSQKIDDECIRQERHAVLKEIYVNKFVNKKIRFLSKLMHHLEDKRKNIWYKMLYFLYLQDYLFLKMKKP